jgi:hypothetical protein
MARCLDLMTGVHHLTEADVEAAFSRARDGRPAILAGFDHDYRDIAQRLDDFRELVATVAGRNSGVPWRHAAPVEAVCNYLDVPAPPRLELDAAVHGGDLHIRASAPLFQSLP